MFGVTGTAAVRHPVAHPAAGGCARMMAVLVLLLAMLSAAPADEAFRLYRAREFAEAERRLRASLRTRPADAAARLLLARTLVELGRTAEGAEEVRRVLAGPVDEEIRFQAGRLLRTLAERRFAQLEALAPESAATLEFSGERYERAGNLDEAMRLYSAAARRAPQRPGIHYRLGNVLWRKREVDKAAEALRAELALSPAHGLANLRLGQILMAGDRVAEALGFLERAVASSSELIEARRELGKAFRRLGDPVRARSEWEAVARARPADDQVFYLLAGLYRELGEGDRAAEALARHREILARRRDRTAEP